MILCLDSGNSRLKWGLHDGDCWLESGAAVQAEADAALTALTLKWPVPQRILLANVAGKGAERRFRAALAKWPVPLEEVSAQPAAGGVENGYQQPGQLGVDRWCALIGARALLPATPLLVVMAGTATTADILQADGRFLGGYILPGLAMMRAALAQGTAALPATEGGYQPLPVNTHDAIESGCRLAQVGAIERIFRQTPALSGGRVLFSGGALGHLADILDCPFQVADNLVLFGLLHLSGLKQN